MRGQSSYNKGFTLIELSIVLVVIGLIVGGILVGQSLITAATVRAQITQIEKYNQAANTFFEKYRYLPGDMPPAAITQLGFTAGAARSGGAGDGDGNGELDSGGTDGGQGQENVYFWEDLSTNSNLIEGGFNAAPGPQSHIDCTSIATCSVLFPYAKIGNGAFVYVYSGYQGCPTSVGCGPNFFGLSLINGLSFGSVSGAPALTVAQAYTIDSKIDDGLPGSGNVLAQYVTNTHPAWSAQTSSPTASTCFYYPSGKGAYYLPNANLVNCGISFKMQAGD
jgi:prepilin-type N-terminal cleavage/methylation domain-containing protein